MSSFWIAVCLSIITSAIYIALSVIQQKKSLLVKENSAETSNSISGLIVLLCSLLVIPVGYLYLGNLESQEKWLEVNHQFEKIQLGQYQTNSSLKQNTDVRGLLLGLRTAIHQEPNNGQLWFMLAESYFQLRMVDLADAAITKALEIEPRPDWFVANAQILSMRSSESDISKSIYLLQSALSIQSNHQSALLTLGFVHFRLNEFQNAINYWQRLVTQLKQQGNDTLMIERQISFAKNELNKSVKE